MWHIELMKQKVEFYEGKVFRSETGYAFVNEFGNCYIIVYGETLRKAYEKALKIK